MEWNFFRGYKTPWSNSETVNASEASKTDQSFSIKIEECTWGCFQETTPRDIDGYIGTIEDTPSGGQIWDRHLCNMLDEGSVQSVAGQSELGSSCKTNIIR
jgi:hypothetical protein